jgi:hypothetical protein
VQCSSSSVTTDAVDVSMVAVVAAAVLLVAAAVAESQCCE